MTYPLVPLAKIALPIARPVVVEPGVDYRTIGVKWWGEGAYERETIDGSRTAAKQLSIVRSDDLIINKIWVRHGSVAIATDAVDGCAASGEFPTFQLDQSRIVPRWLHWLTKTSDFWHRCSDLSRGTSGKNRIRPEVFLTIEIPLPPISEQQRLVARIEALAAKIAEAQGLRQRASDESAFVVSAAVRRATELTGERVQLGSLFVRKPQYGIFGKTSHAPPGVPVIKMHNIDIDGAISLDRIDFYDVGGVDSTPYVVSPGDFLINRTNSRELVGKCTIIPDDHPYSGELAFGHHLIRLHFDTSLIDPHFVALYLNTPLARQEQIDPFITHSTGLHQINGQTIAKMTVPRLSLSSQREAIDYISGVQAQVDAVKRLQAETAVELDALLPAVLDRAFKGAL